MKPGERQYDIAIIIARKPGSDVMTLRQRCDDSNTEIIMVKEGWRECQGMKG